MDIGQNNFESSKCQIKLYIFSDVYTGNRTVDLVGSLMADVEKTWSSLRHYSRNELV